MHFMAWVQTRPWSLQSEPAWLWLGLEGSWPSCIETHWPEIWLERQRPSYTTSFAAPGPNPPICSLFKEPTWFPFGILIPEQFANTENSVGPLRLSYILSTYFLIYNHSYVTLIQVSLILRPCSIDPCEYPTLAGTHHRSVFLFLLVRNLTFGSLKLSIFLAVLSSENKEASH